MAKNQAEADAHYWLYTLNHQKSQQLTGEKRAIDAQIALLEEAKASLTTQVRNIDLLINQEFPKLREKTDHFRGTRRDEFNRTWSTGRTNLIAYKADHDENITTIAQKITQLQEASASLLREITMTDTQADWNYQQYLLYR